MKVTHNFTGESLVNRMKTSSSRISSGNHKVSHCTIPLTQSYAQCKLRFRCPRAREARNVTVGRFGARTDGARQGLDDPTSAAKPSSHQFRANVQPRLSTLGHSAQSPNTRTKFSLDTLHQNGTSPGRSERLKGWKDGVDVEAVVH